jgi:hypothetical protein
MKDRKAEGKANGEAGSRTDRRDTSARHGPVTADESRRGCRSAVTPGLLTSEPKTLKGRELQERSGTKQGREPGEEQAVKRA